MPSPQPDFRHDASRQTLRLLSDSHLDCTLDSPQSLCIPIDPSIKAPLYRFAVTPWLLSGPALLPILFAPVYALLILTPWVDANLRTLLICLGSLVAGIVLLAFSFRWSTGYHQALFASTLGPRLPELQTRVTQRWWFCLEDPATYKKQKTISEDYATGGFDQRHPGLLLEGMRYRYVIRPADVTEVLSDRDYLVITCLIGGLPFTIALNVHTEDCDPDAGKQALQSIRDLLSPDPIPAAP